MATSSKAKVKVMSLKLLIDTKSNRLVFAEAGKDFVDFLFNLLHLPVGTVVRLLKEQTIAGTLGNLFDSVQNLKETYFQTDQIKDSVLNPKIPFSATEDPLLSLHGGKTSYYTCQPLATLTYVGTGKYDTAYSRKFHPYFSDKAGDVCPTCRKSMSEEIKYAAAGKVAAVGEGGIVREGTYMVMDDLEVTPMSASAWFTMLNKFDVKKVGALEEKVVDLGMPEALKLLNASLHSKKVLTSAFLGK